MGIGIGLIGAVIILLAWAYETYKSSKESEKIDLKFTSIYIVGIGILALYSLQIGDLPFIILNGSILVMHLIELDFGLRRKKGKFKLRKRKS